MYTLLVITHYRSHSVIGESIYQSKGAVYLSLVTAGSPWVPGKPLGGANVAVTRGILAKSNPLYTWGDEAILQSPPACGDHWPIALHFRPIVTMEMSAYCCAV